MHLVKLVKKSEEQVKPCVVEVGQFSKEKALKLATQYSSILDFMTNDIKAYHSAREFGFVSDIKAYYDKQRAISSGRLRIVT